MKIPLVRVDWIGKYIGKYTPSYETEGASGADLKADIPAPVEIAPGSVVKIPTGIRIKMSMGWEGQVRSRSGLAAKNGVFVVNSPGTIDSDYTGEISILLTSLKEPFIVEPGMRIAQIVFAEVEQAQFREEHFKDSTSRNPAGFGTTGLK